MRKIEILLALILLHEVHAVKAHSLLPRRLAAQSNSANAGDTFMRGVMDFLGGIMIVELVLLIIACFQRPRAFFPFRKLKDESSIEELFLVKGDKLVCNNDKISRFLASSSKKINEFKASIILQRISSKVSSIKDLSKEIQQYFSPEDEDLLKVGNGKQMQRKLREVAGLVFNLDEQTLNKLGSYQLRAIEIMRKIRGKLIHQI